MTNVWTHGEWTVKPGHEDEFVDLWRELARRGVAAFRTVAPPTLLRDHDRPNVFLSFGPWPSIAEVTRFRSSDVFGDARERMGAILESFETRTLDEVSTGG